MWAPRISVSLLTCCLIGVASAGKQKVCVIGAGATGLASAKEVAALPDEFDLVVYEKDSDVGGLWIYSDNVGLDKHGMPVHSSMYKKLRTNLPKELMAFPDYQEFNDPDDRSAVTHETVLSYLRNYTDHFNLRKYIKFDTFITKVVPKIGDANDWRTTKWQLSAMNLNTNETFEETCDAVMVCNGHYFTPRVPKIPGIETFPGKMIHSHFYRKPEDFAGQTVVLLGANPSGADISIEVAGEAKKVYLSHNKDRITSQLPANLEQVAGVVSANGSTLTLKDGSTIQADVFVYCTGYVFEYPFLDASSGITVEDNQVAPLYKHLVNIEQPSMALVGLPIMVVHYPLFYAQAKYFVQLLRGKAQLPPKADMLKDSELPADRPKRYAHFLGPAQWDYNDDLLRAGGLEPLPKWYRHGFHLWHELRNADVLHYKESNLRIGPDGKAEIVRPKA